MRRVFVACNRDLDEVGVGISSIYNGKVCKVNLKVIWMYSKESF